MIERQPFDKLLFIDIHNNYVLNTLSTIICKIEDELKELAFYYSFISYIECYVREDDLDMYMGVVKLINIDGSNDILDKYIDVNKVYTPLRNLFADNKIYRYRSLIDIVCGLMKIDNKRVNKLVSKLSIMKRRYNTLRREMGL